MAAFRHSAAIAALVAASACGVADRSAPAPADACGLQPCADASDAAPALLPPSAPPSPVAASTAIAACPDDARAADGTCTGVPPERCADGFAADGDRGCAPVLAAGQCPDGQTTWLGETACHPIRPCADGTWGDIPVEADTVYVDASYRGGFNDGSRARPWTNLRDGLESATPGAIVAVAAGDYTGWLETSTRVRLWGVCPEKVVIHDPKSAAFAVVDDGTEIHGVALSGHEGIDVVATDVVVDGVWIHDVDGFAVVLEDLPTDARFTLRNTRIERAGGGAIGLLGGGATLDHVAVGDVGTAAPPAFSDCLTTVASTSHAHHTIRRSTFERCTRHGAFIDSSDVDLDGVLFRDSADVGVRVQRGANVTCTGCVVDRASSAAMIVLGSTVALDATLLADTRPLPGQNTAIAAAIQPSDDGTVPSTVSMGHATIRGMTGYSIAVYASTARLDATFIRGRTDGRGAMAAFVDALVTGTPTFEMRSSAIVDPSYIGLLLAGGVADLVGTRIHAVHAIRDGFGDGISFDDMTGTVRACAIDGAPRAAISNFGSHVAIGASRFDDNGIDLDREAEEQLLLPIGVFADEGANVCRLGGEAHLCEALSAGLTSPTGGAEDAGH